MRLVGLLVSMAIIVAIGYFVFRGNPNAPKRADGQGETVIGRSMLAAKDDKCLSNLGQTRQFIQIATDPVDDTRPQSLDEAKVPHDFQVCPIGKESYTYDPATGQVHCPHPGHEKY